MLDRAISLWENETFLNHQTHVELLLEQLPEIAHKQAILHQLLMRAHQLYAAQPWLTYHNWTHISQMVSRYNALWGTPTTEIQLAIAYHDCVYVPGAYEYTNESLSAKAFTYHFNTLVPENCRQWFDAEFVCELILATSVQNHVSATYKPDSYYKARLLDCDLSSLAQPYEMFLRTQHDIRVEYLGPFGSQVQASGKQAEFLEHFLEKPSIYHTEEARTHWEEQARENIARFCKEN